MDKREYCKRWEAGQRPGNEASLAWLRLILAWWIWECDWRCLHDRNQASMTYIWQPVLLTCDLCYCTKFHYTLLCCVCLGGSEDCWFRMVSPRPFFQTFNSMWDSRLPSTWNGGEQTAWRKGVEQVDVKNVHFPQHCLQHGNHYVEQIIV